MRGYRLQWASDVSDRDGLALELLDRHGRTMAEVFRDDTNGSRTFNAFTNDSVPLDVVSWMLRKAADEL